MLLPALRVDAGTLAPAAPRDLLEVWFSGKSSLTVAAYRADLEAFAAWAGIANVSAALDAFLALSQGDANAAALTYRGAMLEQGLAAATVNRRLASLRSVVQLGRMLGRVVWTLDVPNVEAAKYRDTRGPGLRAFRAMLAEVATGTDAKSRRDFALLRVLFDMALRREELVSCDLAHYDRAAATLSIRGKKRRERENVTVPPQTAAALDAWIAVRGDAPGPLFVPLSRAGIGERLTGRSVARVVADIARRAGVGHVRPHGLRHSGITALLEVGNSVQDVQQFSRHKDVRTVMIYNDNRSDVAGKMAAMLAALV